MRKYPLVPIALAIIAGILLAHHFAFFSTQLWLWALAACAIVVGILLIKCCPPPENTDLQQYNNAIDYLLLSTRWGARLTEREWQLDVSLPREDIP